MAATAEASAAIAETSTAATEMMVVTELLTKMLTLAGTARYRTEYGERETPTKQAYWVLNGIGRYMTEWPLPDSKSSGSDTVGDHGQE